MWKLLTLLLTLIPSVAAADFGWWPDCTAPSIPLEVHSWWLQPGEPHARHLHLAACAPNSRDTTGGLVSLSTREPLHVKVTSFNNPGTVSWVRWSWESDIKQRITMNKPCQSAPNQLQECSWWVDFTLDPFLASRGGLRELRLSPNITTNDLGERQFGTLNFQIYLNNGKTPSNYRSRPNPIGRSWYSTGFDYANVEVNYTDFFRGAGDLGKSIPTVGGVVPLRIRHREGNFAVRSQLWQDPDFHANPDSWHQGVGRLYTKPGRFDGTYNWDTRQLPNGRHWLYFETVDEGPTGTNAGALKLPFDVQN